MRTYIIRRILLMIPTWIGITLFVFTITRLAPGGPVERQMMNATMMAAEGKGGGMAGSMGHNEANAQPLDEGQLQYLKELYGFDKPILQAYGIWVSKVLHGDLGDSTRYWDPVWDMIVERMPISIYFGSIVTLLTYLVCIPLGLFKAIFHKSSFDTSTSVLVFVGYAIPAYVIALVLLYFLGFKLEWFPLGDFTSEGFEEFTFFEKAKDLLWHTALPLISMLITGFAGLTVLMKNTVMDNLSSDYVRTAMAKGVTFKRAVFGHALRNSLAPMASSFAGLIGIVLTGNFLIEIIFNIDGMGLLTYQAVTERDYPVYLGFLVISAMIMLVSNLLGDLILAVIDPRVRFK